VGSSKKALDSMPSDVQDVFGYALHLAQEGGQHDDAKVMKGFGGAGVLEVVETDQDGSYRAVYTVRFEKAVYVLHVFQKKSKSGIKTPKKDLDLIKLRLKAAQLDHEQEEES
jgi:phage-related protein